MYAQIVSGDEAVYTVINAFKPEIEHMNLAKSREEMQDLRESAVNDA